MKLLILSLLTTLTIACTFVQAQNPAAVDSIFAEWNQSGVPGGAVGIIHNKKLIYAKGYGSADLEHGIGITPESKFYIGSVSKQFVTFSILLLEEQGKLNLDDNIQQYLPDFPEYDAPLTIRHFIHHTSGVRDFLTLMNLRDQSYLDHADRREVYRLIKNQKELNFTPGKKYLYSNSCYLMLAMIVEKVSGKRMEEFAREHIFEPLGMQHTLFYEDISDLIENRVFSYQKTDEGFDNLISRFDLVGSGGIYSTIEDLYRWDQNFYDNKLGEGNQKIIETMHEEGTLNNGEHTGYAFALINGTYKGLKTVSHGGSLAGYRAHLVRFPEQQFSVVILSNRSDANPAGMSYRIADLFLKEHFKKKEAPATRPASTNRPETNQMELQQLTGRYAMDPGVVVSLRIQNDSLYVLQEWNQEIYPIRRLHGNTFVIPEDRAIIFKFTEFSNGPAAVLTVVDNGNRVSGKRIMKSNIEDIDLNEYTGRYYSEELDVTYHLYVEDNMLKMSIGLGDPSRLIVIDAQRFTSYGKSFRFSRDETSTISGFHLDAGRVQNLKFTKQ